MEISGQGVGGFGVGCPCPSLDGRHKQGHREESSRRRQRLGRE